MKALIAAALMTAGIATAQPQVKFNKIGDREIPKNVTPHTLKVAEVQDEFDLEWTVMGAAQSVRGEFEFDEIPDWGQSKDLGYMAITGLTKGVDNWGAGDVYFVVVGMAVKPSKRHIAFSYWPKGTKAQMIADEYRDEVDFEQPTDVFEEQSSRNCTLIMTEAQVKLIITSKTSKIRIGHDTVFTINDETKAMMADVMTKTNIKIQEREAERAAKKDD